MQRAAFPGDDNSPVAVGQIEDLSLDARWDAITGVLPKRGHHLRGVKARGASIPDGEGCETIGMNVFRTLYQLRRISGSKGVGLYIAGRYCHINTRYANFGGGPGGRG
jgi:hypothetical protein